MISTIEPTVDMQVSPYDRNPTARSSKPPLVQLAYSPKQRWVPSRYNARTVGDDGRLILWNTLTGAISVFRPQDREKVLAALAWQGIAAPLDKVSSYLSRRGFLVNESVDELNLFRLKYAQQQWRTDIMQFILLASEDCNFRCVYCYEKFKAGTMQPEVREGLRALVTKRAPHLKELNVSWFGGEPLYGWEAVEDLSPFFHDIAEKHGMAHWQNMTTNGYLLTEERATRLLEWGCRQYQITVDGLAEDHDCKRVGRDGSPTHAVVLENLRSLHQRKEWFHATIRVNFDQHNFTRLGAFMESLSEDFGGDGRFKLNFYPVGRWGSDHDDDLDICGTREGRDVIRELREKAYDLDLEMEGGIRDVAPFGSQACYAARPYNFVVGATGKLMKCTIALDNMEENVVGRILADGTLELIDERMMHWVNPHFETDSLCKSCYVLPGCQGAACPLTRVRSNTRSCCGIKSDLKREMRFTLEGSGRTRLVNASAAV